MWLLLAALSAGLSASGEEPSAENMARPVSFAISGGASKGAYEAGLNWGIVRVFSELETGGTALGGRYRGFDVVSFAGASAGGINTLLGGLSWCMRPEADGGPANRIDDNIFRDVWLLPDVNSLLPPEADSPRYLPDDALLARADFLGAAEGLRDLWRRPAFEPGCRVPLGVTVTRNKPEQLKIADVPVGNQRFFVPFELRVMPDSSIRFFFDPDDYPTVSDPAMILMPRTADEPPFHIDDDDVISLALTTSAFPGGFGRRKLTYCRNEQFMPGNGPEPVGAHPAQALICPDGYVLAESVFSDGGLFDNLPVGLARTLAERRAGARSNPLPVTYIYLDPDRLRYAEPAPTDPRACDLPNPPEACIRLAYNLSSEAGMLLGAFGTAREFELYSELTSGSWSLNLGDLAAELADAIEAADRPVACDDLLPIFDRALDCPDALRLGGNLLRLSHGYVEAPIVPPYSSERLVATGLATGCAEVGETAQVDVEVSCRLDRAAARRMLGEALDEVVARAGLEGDEVARQVARSGPMSQEDRRLFITSRGAPITGTLLGSFGAFLDFEFREYDYFIGVYDAVVLFSETLCGSVFSAAEQPAALRECVDVVAERAHRRLGVADHPRARYVFALTAKRSFEDTGALRFAWDPMPEVDRNMLIIHEGLERTLEAGRPLPDPTERSVSVEEEFFTTLRDEGFVPTPNADGSEPLLAQIMEDPEYWSAVLIRRATSRLVLLEQQAKALYEEQEPDPAKRSSASPTLMGTAAYVLQSSSYRYPGFTFAPSVAPPSWGWRNVIPFELAFDFASNDIVLSWQPTISLDRHNNLGFRLGLGLSRGLVTSDPAEEDDSFASFGLDYTHLTSGSMLSSWGFSPIYFYTFDETAVANQSSLGVGVHFGFLKNRLRISAGLRDVSETDDSFFVLFGLADLPGAIYWLTR
jgi:hypothetical protein